MGRYGVVLLWERRPRDLLWEYHLLAVIFPNRHTMPYSCSSWQKRTFMSFGANLFSVRHRVTLGPAPRLAEWGLARGVPEQASDNGCHPYYSTMPPRSATHVLSCRRHLAKTPTGDPSGMHECLVPHNLPNTLMILRRYSCLERRRLSD